VDPDGQGSGGTPGAEQKPARTGKGRALVPPTAKGSAVPVPGSRAEAMLAAQKAAEKAAKKRRQVIYLRRIGPKRIVFRGVVTALFAWWLTNVGGHPGVEFSEVAVGVATGISGLATLGAVGEWAEAMARPLPPAVAAGPPGPEPPDADPAGPAAVPELGSGAGALPPVDSAARAPMERLSRLERSLADLLTLLGADAPADVAGEAEQAAATLREYGARLRVVESARDGVTGDAAAGVNAAVETLRLRIEEGVTGYERLVAVAADAVSVGTADGLDQRTVRRLEDAADALAGLARGLRELRGELT
jgi:hypothetical protein